MPNVADSNLTDPNILSTRNTSRNPDTAFRCKGKKLMGKSVLLLVSVGSDNYENPFFMEAVWGYFTKNYKKNWQGSITVLVGDYIQWYSMIVQKLLKLEQSCQDPCSVQWGRCEG